MSGIVLRFDSITKRFRKSTALDSVSFTLQQGRKYGLVGNFGAGKSTLIRLIAGEIEPDSGEITFYENGGLSDLKKLREQLGYNRGEFYFYDSMTVFENLRAQGILLGKSPEDVRQLIRLVGLEGQTKTAAKKLLPHELQRLNLALALLKEPKILLLDEPFLGTEQDKSAREQLVRTVVPQLEDKTVLIAARSMNDVWNIADEFIILHLGQVKEIITKEDIRFLLSQKRFATPEDYFVSLTREGY